MAKKENGRVDLHIPRGEGKHQEPVMIGLNGVIYLLPRGQTHSVPAEVAEEYYRSERAKERLAATMSNLLQQAQAPV